MTTEGQIIELQDKIINDLIEVIERIMDCEKLPCYRLISEVAELKKKELELRDNEGAV